jgi:hypothetical protein
MDSRLRGNDVFNTRILKTVIPAQAGTHAERSAGLQRLDYGGIRVLDLEGLRHFQA